MSKVLIIKLILYYANLNGLDGNTALSIAKIESGLNPNSIGLAKEVGIFQIKSEYSLYSKEELLDPVTNIKEGIRILKLSKETCSHRKGSDWVICFNLGKKGASKIRYPALFPYKKKFDIAMSELK